MSHCDGRANRIVLFITATEKISLKWNAPELVRELCRILMNNRSTDPDKYVLINII